MRLLFSVLRFTGFTTTAPLAVLLGVAGALLTEHPAEVPSIRLPLPPGTLMPVLAVLAFSWTLHDRSPHLTRTAVLAASRVGVYRLLGTALVCALPSAIAARSWGCAEPVAITVLGVTLTSVSAALLGSRVWLLVLGGGYAWLRHAASLPLGSQLDHDLVLAVAGVGVAAALLVARSD